MTAVNNCPKCNTPPETRNWHTYCPTCNLEGPFGETPQECEANWNAMTAKTETL